MLRARLSSNGRITIPKTVRERLGFAEGDRLAVRVEGDEVILRKAARGSWREWDGRLKESNLLADLAEGRLQELAHDRR